MQKRRRLQQFVALAVVCTLFIGVLAAQGTIIAAVTGLANKLQSPRQLLDNMTFSQRVTLLVDGRERQLWTGANTVQEVIDKAGVTLGPFDYTEPELTESIADNQQIKVIRVEEREVEEQAVVPFHTVKVATRTLNRGESREVRTGVNGKLLNTYRILFENGQQVKRELVKTVTLVEKQDRVIEEGTMATLSRGGHVYRYSQMINVTATAYTADYNPIKQAPDDPWRGLTSTGQRAVAGLTIATDPRVIPMGARVYVEGVDSTGKQFSGTYVAMDVGSAIKGNRIDIYVDTHERAVYFGRRKMRVYILE
jgi:3D (Asp-Asp-Asp) domain-containing protein